MKQNIANTEQSQGIAQSIAPFSAIITNIGEFWVAENRLANTQTDPSLRVVALQGEPFLQVRGRNTATNQLFIRHDLPIANGVISVNNRWNVGIRNGAVVSLSQPQQRRDGFIRINGWGWGTPPVAPHLRQFHAQEIINRADGASITGRRITLQPLEGTPDGSGRSARDNLAQTVNGQEARRSEVDRDGRAVGGTVPISEHLLEAILRISDRYANTIQVNALAGHRHYRNSRHYGHHANNTLTPPLPRLGMAVDLQVVNGNVVGTGASRRDVLTFLEGIGFRTQRTFPGAPSNNNYDTSGAGIFHLEIWGRS